MTRRLSRLFLLITLVGELHMVEQLMTDIEEFHMLGGLVVAWQEFFPPGMDGQASVVLITLAFLTVSMVVFAALRGGRASVLVVGGFGLFGVGEAHHWLEAVQKGGYDPGLLTSVAYVAVGAAILWEAWTALASPLAATSGSPRSARPDRCG